MNEVEKMYRNSGIEKHKKTMLDIETGKNVLTLDSFYPEFTAEKQIELIKWLIQKYKDISIEHKLNLFYINIRDIYTGMVHIELDETLAGLINNLWQSLTDADKAQIKEILE